MAERRGCWENHLLSGLLNENIPDGSLRRTVDRPPARNRRELRLLDRFEDLRTFVTLAQAGGFAAAADRLGIVKSAVSRRIREFEERLDVRLVHRTTRQISLTDAGRAYYDRAVESSPPLNPSMTRCGWMATD